MNNPTLKVIAGIAIVAAITCVIWPRQRVAEPPVPKAEATPGQPSESSNTVVASAQVPAVNPQIEELKGQLAEERRGRQRVEAEAASLREQVAPLSTNVVISLGTVKDMGQRAGTLLPALGELQALSARDPGALSPEEKRRLLELQRDHARLLGELPEITRFQDSPADYGQFFSSMLQQAAGLTDPQAAQVGNYMRERGNLMNQLGLNVGRQPGDAELAEAWEKRRDEFNEQTADGLKQIMPVGAAEKAGFGPGLMEFLEMDFDKLNVHPPGLPAQ